MFEGKTKEIIETSRFIYEHLGDEISKELYRQRMIYAMAGEEKGVLENVLSCQPSTKYMIDSLSKTKKNYLYGAGIEGRWIAKIFLGYWKGFIDNDPQKQGTMIEGLEVFSPDILNVDGEYNKVIVTPTEYAKDIIISLMQQGISKDKISDWGSTIQELRDGQYFDLPFLNSEEDEIFIDAGGFDGGSSLHFAKWAKGVEHIYIFEPDKNNILLCRTNIENANMGEYTTIVEKGCWSKSTTLHFQAFGNHLSHICEEKLDDDEDIEVAAIDEILQGNKVTFIKMDVESAELEALKGAQNTIITWKPKLAICVYHKPEDIFTIPQLILQYNPNYTLYLRHYSYLDLAETVLYAI